jgi:hypothetical protein
LATTILPELECRDDRPLQHDSSTSTLIRRYRSMRWRPEQPCDG